MENENEEVTTVYVVELDKSQIMYDQNLNHLVEDEYEPLTIHSFQQNALASEEQWEEYSSFDEDALIDVVRRLIRAKMKQIASELELH